MKILSFEEFSSSDKINENVNDPVLMALRVAKEQRKKMMMDKKEREKRRVYGAKREKMEDRLEDIWQEIKDLKREQSDLYREMDLEAGQKGANWTDADGNRYGDMLNKIDDQLEALYKERVNLETKLAL
jgi:hypothetical protein